jgi:hypothetical protein
MQISGIALHSPSPTGFVYLEFSWMHAPFVFSSTQPYPYFAIAVLFYYLDFAWGDAWKFLSQQCSINTCFLYVYFKNFFLTILKVMYFLLYKLRLFSLSFTIFLYKYSLYFLLVPPFSCENITLIFVHIFISSEL